MEANDRSPRAARLRLLAAHVAAGVPVTEAAKASGMALTTAHRALRRPEVLAEVRAARDPILDQTVGKLAALVPKVLAELGALISNANGPVRLARLGRSSLRGEWRKTVRRCGSG